MRKTHMEEHRAPLSTATCAIPDMAALEGIVETEFVVSMNGPQFLSPSNDFS
jgi:hypothetical protein